MGFKISKIFPFTQLKVVFTTVGLFLFLCTYNSLSIAQNKDANPQPIVPFSIWQGFSLKWDSPILYTQLGNYIEDADCAPQKCDVRATMQVAGGKDVATAEFSSYYSHVTQTQIRTITGTGELVFNVKKGELIHTEATVSYPFLPQYPRLDFYTVVLNGFVIESPKPIVCQTFTLGIGDAYHQTNENRLTFDIFGSLQANFSGKVVVKVLYLLLLDENSATPFSIKRNHYWHKKYESVPENPPITVKGNTNPAFTIATVGIKKISWLLDKPHPMYKLNYGISDISYNNAELKCKPNVVFQQWGNAMKKGSRKDGVAEMVLDIVMLQFKQGCIHANTVEGKHKWKGKDATNPKDDGRYSSLSSHPTQCK